MVFFISLQQLQETRPEKTPGMPVRYEIGIKTDNFRFLYLLVNFLIMNPNFFTIMCQSRGIVSSCDTSSQILVRAWIGMLGSLEISSIFEIASAARSPIALELFVSSVRVSSATRRIFRGIETVFLNALQHQYTVFQSFFRVGHGIS